METVGIPTLCTRWRWVVNFTSRCEVKNARGSMVRRLGKPQSPSGRTKICLTLARNRTPSPPPPNPVARHYNWTTTALYILWRTVPLLRGDSVNSHYYGAPAVYVCAVTSHNNGRGDAGGVFCRSALRPYVSTDRVLLSEWVQCSWGFTGGVLNNGIISVAKISYQETSSEDTAEE
jgi:hypothetical protein